MLKISPGRVAFISLQQNLRISKIAFSSTKTPKMNAGLTGKSGVLLTSVNYDDFVLVENTID